MASGRKEEGDREGGNSFLHGWKACCDVKKKRGRRRSPVGPKIGKVLMGHLKFPNKSDLFPIFKTRKLKR